MECKNCEKLKQENKELKKQIEEYTEANTIKIEYPEEFFETN